jgi:hypothetical protein
VPALTPHSSSNAARAAIAPESRPSICRAADHGTKPPKRKGADEA